MLQAPVWRSNMLWEVGSIGFSVSGISLISMTSSAAFVTSPVTLLVVTSTTVSSLSCSPSSVELKNQNGFRCCKNAKSVFICRMKKMKQPNWPQAKVAVFDDHQRNWRTVSYEERQWRPPVENNNKGFDSQLMQTFNHSKYLTLYVNDLGHKTKTQSSNQKIFLPYISMLMMIWSDHT